MVIKGYQVGALAKCTSKEILADGVPGLAAQTAYYFFFSLFPLYKRSTFKRQKAYMKSERLR